MKPVPAPARAIRAVRRVARVAFGRCCRRPASLRGKLTLSSIGMLAIGVVVATCISLVGIKHYLLSAIDSELLRTRTAIEHTHLTSEQAAAIGTVADLGRNRHPAYMSSATGNKTLIVALGPDGGAREFAKVPPGAKQRALAAAVTDARDLAHDPEPHDVKVDGVLHRATAVRLGDGRMLLMASSMSGVGEVMRKVVRLEVLIGGALMAGLGAATFYGARRRLRPLEDMVETASAIAEGNADGEAGAAGLGLSRRVAAPPQKQAVSEVEQLRLALNAMLHQVEAAFLTREHAAAHLRRFVADASHELRTPLAAIRGYLQLYERGMLVEDGERARALARMTAESERMAHLVDELLALARLDQRPELRPRPVDLAHLAQEALADLAAQQPGRPVEFAGPGPGPGAGAGGRCLVLADESVLRQVVGNLVANVRVHTPATARVTVSVRAEGEHGVLRVADEGPGMPPEDAERVFDRFFRAGAAEGSGLGMSVVRAGTEAQGGTVRVSTAPGAGLTVTVVLPAAGAGAETDGEICGAAEGAGQDGARGQGAAAQA